MRTGRSKKKQTNEKHSFLSFMVWFIILVIIGFLGQKYVTKSVAEFFIGKSLGVRVSVNNVDLNIFKSSFTVKRLIIYNPPGFSGTLAEVPYIYANYDRESILNRKPYIKELEINLYEVSIVKNRNHDLNLNRMKAIIDRKKLEDSATNKIRTKINNLALSTDHVYFIDYTVDKPVSPPKKILLNKKKITNLNNFNEIVLFLINRVSKNSQ